MREFIEIEYQCDLRPCEFSLFFLLYSIWYVCTNNLVEILARGRSKLADPALHLAKKKRGCDIARYRRHPLAKKKLVASPLTRWIFSLHLSWDLPLFFLPLFLSVTKHRRLSLRYVPSTCVNPLESSAPVVGFKSRACEYSRWCITSFLKRFSWHSLPLYFALRTTHIIYRCS